MIPRLFFAFAALLIGGALAMYVFTKDQRYKKLVGQFLRFFLVLFVAIALFYVIERLILI